MQQDYPKLEYIANRLKGPSDHKIQASWLEASIEYLKEFKAGGIIERFFSD